MRREMTKKDIIPMDFIKELLAKPLTDLSQPLVLKDYYITSRKEFNKVMYLVYEGQLRQFKIKKGIKFPFNFYNPMPDGLNGSSSKRINNILIIDVAGIGELAVAAPFWGYTFEFYIYDSVDSFKNGDGRPLYSNITELMLRDIFSNVGTIESSNLVRYTWNGTNAVRCPLQENVSLFFTYDDKTFDNQMHGHYDGYATKDECERDNAIQLAVFAEDEKEEEPQNVVVRCNIEINGEIYDIVDDETLLKIKKLLNY